MRLSTISVIFQRLGAWRVRVLGLVAAMLLLSACDPNALMHVRRSDTGINLEVTAEFAAPPTAEQFAQWYGLIVTGTVTKVLPAQWSTPDGLRPADFTPADVPDTYAIITPAVVTLEGSPLVDRNGVDVSSGSIVVAALGGKVDKDEITTNDPSQHLQVGDHLLIGLIDRSRNHDGKPQYQTAAGPAWSIGLIYRLTAAGDAIVAIPDGTPVPTQVLLQEIKNTAQAGQ